MLNIFGKHKKTKGMKLGISRKQADQKGLFGGHLGVTFTTFFKIALDQDEVELVRKYKVEKTVLSGDGADKNAITIERLLNGITLNESSLDNLIKTEKVIVQSCRSFRNYLDILKSFGGDTIYEFKADGVYKDGKLLDE